MSLLFSMISFLTGAAVTMQSAVNGRLRAASGNPVFASLFSFLGGMVLLVVMLPLASALGIYPLPSWDMLLSTKWWMWTGGVFGTALVFCSILIPPKIGFGAYFSMMVAGQLTGSVLADATGFLGSQVHPVSPLRLLGVILLIAGAVLVQRPGRSSDADAAAAGMDAPVSDADIAENAKAVPQAKGGDA